MVMGAAAALLAFAAGGAQARAELVPSVVEARPDLAQRTFALVNSYRGGLGLPALAWDDRLAAAAAWFAQDRISLCRLEEQVEQSGGQVNVKWSWSPAFDCLVTHEDSRGRLPWDRAAAFGFPSRVVGENVALAWHESAERALDLWVHSPPHDGNQRRPDWQVAAAGVACQRFDSRWIRELGSSHRVACYYVMMFGIVGSGSARQAPPAVSSPSSPVGGAGPAGGRAISDPCAGRQAAEPPAERSVHRVEPGETLAGLAERYLGDPSRYCDLAAWSGISAPYLLRAGQEVVVPSQGGGQVQPAEEKPVGVTEGTPVGVQEPTGTDEAAAPPHLSAPLPDRLAGDYAGSEERGQWWLQVLREIGRGLRQLWPF